VAAAAKFDYETSGLLMSQVWKRARNDEQKQLRKTALLDAASRLFPRHPLDEISLNGIAREANVSKANVYRYFESREALFLDLMVEEMSRWVETLAKELPQGATIPVSTVERDELFIAAVITASRQNESFGQLVSVLATILERNVSAEVVTAFKLRMKAEMVPLFQAVAPLVPDFSAEELYDLLHMIYLQLGALWPVAHPAPAVVEALKHPELAEFCVKFDETLSKCVRIHLAGTRALRAEEHATK